MVAKKTDLDEKKALHPPGRLLMVFLATILLSSTLVVVVMAAPIIDPASTGFGGANRTQNMINLTENWRRYNNVTFTVSVNGKNLEVVPWMSRGDQCLLSQGANGLHACATTTPPFDNLNLSNQTFCQVTDEMSQLMLSDAGGTNNATRLDNWVNTIEAYQTCGQAGNLTEWVAGIRYIGGGNWEFNCSQVSDSATDADAHIIVALAAINNSAIANITTRDRAGDLLGAMCLGLADHNFLPYNITNRINAGENISFLPCGGDDVCTSPGNGDFAYTAYNGPIIEALAACQAYYGTDSVQYNWTKLADSTVQAHLQASNWTGSVFTVGNGRSYHWANYTSTGTAYAVCDNSCTPSAYTDDPDAMRAPRICNGGYVWEAYRGYTLRNLTTYCSQWMSLTGESNTTHVTERYFNNTAKSSTSDSGYKAVGLGAFMNTLVNTSFADDRIATYNDHLSWSGGKGTMDSQACFGVYDKAFGIMATEYLIGAFAGAFTANSSSGGGPSSENSGVNITIHSPTNNSVINTTFVLYNITVWNNNNTQIANNTPGALPQILYNSTFAASPASDGWTLNSWLWTADGGGVINNTANSGGAAWTQNLGLGAKTNGYNLSINMSVSNFTNAKLFFGTNSGTQDGDRILFERSGNSLNVKHDGGSYSSFTVPMKQYFILDIVVNLTGNTVRVSTGTNSWSDTLANNHLTVNGSYVAFVPGTEMNPSNQNSTGWNISTINVTNTGTPYNISSTTTGNSTLNVSIQYTNGTVIYAINGVTNGTSVNYTQLGLPNGTYYWLVTAVTKDGTASVNNMTFSINTSVPLPAISFNVSIGSVTNTTAIITVNSSVQGNLTVQYGTSLNLGSYAYNNTVGTTGTISLGSLVAGTTYYVNITLNAGVNGTNTTGYYSFSTNSNPAVETPGSLSEVCDNIGGGLTSFGGMFGVIGLFLGIAIIFLSMRLYKGETSLTEFLVMMGVISLIIIGSVLTAIIVNGLCA